MDNLIGLRFEECDGLSDIGISALASMKLVSLEIKLYASEEWRQYYVDGVDGQAPFEPPVLTAASFLSFAGAAISQSLESFLLHFVYNDDKHIADDQLAVAIASCHKLKRLHVDWGLSNVSYGGCVFGRSNGIVGLQTLAAGCPLLEDVSLKTIDDPEGLLCLAKGCVNLKNVNFTTPWFEYGGYQGEFHESEMYEVLNAQYPHVKLVKKVMTKRACL